MKDINKTPELEIVSIDNLQENIVSAVYSSEDWKEDLRKSFFVEDGAGNLFEVMPTFDEFKKTIVIWNEMGIHIWDISFTWSIWEKSKNNRNDNDVMQTIITTLNKEQNIRSTNDLIFDLFEDLTKN